MFKVTSRTKIDFVNVFQGNPYHATILYIYPFKTSEHPWLTFWCGNIQYINLVLSANIYLFIVNNRNIRKRCEICSKLTMKTLERRHWHHRTYFTPFSNVSTVEFEQVNVNWVGIVNFLQVSCHVSENDMKWNT